MRIIAGTARRTVLVAPKGQDTRPTADIAKESLFNILDVSDTRFLDLFCGSGAIGLEALSRGARDAVFVDNARIAIAAVTQNLQKAKLESFAEILQTSVKDAIIKLSVAGSLFDIIFLDPPYDTNMLQNTLNHLAIENILAKNGIIVAETDSKLYDNIVVPEQLQLTDTRVYGRTCFLFIKKVHK